MGVWPRGLSPDFEATAEKVVTDLTLYYVLKVTDKEYTNFVEDLEQQISDRRVKNKD